MNTFNFQLLENNYALILRQNCNQMKLLYWLMLISTKYAKIIYSNPWNTGICMLLSN